jgi:RND family efflux transporter MFP subunit
MKYQILIISILFFFTACEKTAPKVEKKIRPVRYGKIMKSGAATTNTFAGTSQSSNVANLSFKVAGSINSFDLKIGDKVKKGQVIARIDATDYTVTYDQSLANLKKAESQINSAQSNEITAKSNYERVEKLYENNSVPLSEYEQAKATYESAQSAYEATLAQVTAAQKQSQAANNQVRYAKLVAPFTGIITAVFVAENEIVSPGKPLVTLSAESKPEVAVNVPESIIDQIKRKQKVNISFSAFPDKTFKGTITEVGYASGQASTYPVTIQIDKPTAQMRPGMATNVTFSQAAVKANANKLVAPTAAIGQVGKSTYAFVLEKDSANYKVKKTTVEIGDILPDGFVVKSGLKEGQLVATAGLRALLDGMEVKLMTGQEGDQ